MIAALRSEWLLLNRARLWLALGLTTIAFSVVATALSVAAAEPGPARGRGISSDVLTGAGGATAAVIYAVGFGSILMLAAFTSTAANEFTRGTFRAAVVKHPGRGTLVGGKVLARTGVAALMMAAAVVAGSVTAALVAPSQDISTAGWFGLDGLGQAAGDYVRLVVWALGWAVIGTTIAVARALHADRSRHRRAVVRPDRERDRRRSRLGLPLVPRTAAAGDRRTRRPRHGVDGHRRRHPRRLRRDLRRRDGDRAEAPRRHELSGRSVLCQRERDAQSDALR